MTEKCTYRVKLAGDPDLVKVLSPFVQENQPKLVKARELRRAVETLFGGKIKVDILSVGKGNVKAL